MDPLVVQFDPTYVSKFIPNPTDGTLYIDMTKFMDISVDVMVSDMAGRELMNQTFDQAHERTVQMDMTKL